MNLVLQWWEIDPWSLQQKWCLWIVVWLWAIKWLIIFRCLRVKKNCLLRHKITITYNSPYGSTGRASVLGDRRSRFETWCGHSIFFLTHHSWQSCFRSSYSNLTVDFLRFYLIKKILGVILKKYFIEFKDICISLPYQPFTEN